MPLLLHNDYIIEHYFKLGYSNSEILLCLAWLHNIIISERTLKRRLQRNGLYRRINASSLIDVALFIDNELQTSGRLHGYRWIHRKCRLSGLIVSQAKVSYILRKLDPSGVETRRRRRLQRRQYYTQGPNEIWHIDGYDKLSPYGICIHGAIDGFSRKIIWLEAGSTNHNAAVVAGYYYNTVKLLNGCPKTIRADLGTENGTIELMQEVFRDDSTSFIYGRSCNNQRIEAWWSILRRQHAQFWMDFFGNLKDETYFVGNEIDKALIQFFFIGVIQKELTQVVAVWNTHWIRYSKNQRTFHGRPSIMYSIPTVYSARNCLCHLDAEVISSMEHCCNFQNLPCDETIYELICIIMDEEHLQLPDDIYNRVDMYILVRNIIYDLL